VIVADVNLVAYLYLPGRFTTVAEEWLLREGEWAVPRLWRSEFRNILSTYMREEHLTVDEAVTINARAESLLYDSEYDVPGASVLRLSSQSRCSAYDCEYVALAEHLNVKLVSADAKLCRAFPTRTVLLSR